MGNLDLLAIGAKHSTADQFSCQFTEEQWLAAAREIQAAERAALLELAASTGWSMDNSDTFHEAVRDICQMRERA